MNRYYKIASCLLAAVILISAACKKNTSAPAATDKTAALSKQMALSLYNSLQSGVSTTNKNGLKTGSTSNLKTMDAFTCGQSVTTGTNRTERSGDTTRTIVGNTIFTYMCDGFYHNNTDLDAYILRDTSNITETGAAFKNINKVTLYYVVKSTDANYNGLSVNGSTSDYWFVSKLNGSTTTESHSIATNYTWTSIVADRSGPKTIFTSGIVNYTTTIVDVDATTGATGATYNYTGTMEFLANNKMKVTYNFSDHTTKVYIVDLLTGVTTLVG
jgi:hypothetical protein